MIFLQLSKMDSKDYQLSKEWVNFVEFYNHIIDRFEMTKNQDVIFKEIPDKAIILKLIEIKLPRFFIILFLIR